MLGGKWVILAKKKTPSTEFLHIPDGHAQLAYALYFSLFHHMPEHSLSDNEGTCIQSVGGHHYQCVSPYHGLYNVKLISDSVLSNTSAWF